MLYLNNILYKLHKEKHRFEIFSQKATEIRKILIEKDAFFKKYTDDIESRLVTISIQFSNLKTQYNPKKNLVLPITCNKLPHLHGCLESLKDGDVVFDRNLRIKGWFYLSPNLAIDKIIVLINDKQHTVIPYAIRGEMAERLKNPDLFSFDESIPLNSDGPPLNVALVLVYKDARKQVWQSLKLWANNSIPESHAIPVIKGKVAFDKVQGEFANKKQIYRLHGRLSILDKKPLGLKVFQKGIELLNLPLINLNDDTTREVVSSFETVYKFDYQLSQSLFDDKYPLELWIALSEGQLVHWQRCKALLPKSNADVCWAPANLKNGIVAHGDSISFTIGPINSDVEPKVYVNGISVIAEKTILNKPDYCSLLVPISRAGNDVELIIEIGFEWVALQVWRHANIIEQPQISAVAVPNESCISHAVTLLTNGLPRRVIVIRQSPSPTDELYILSPLIALEELGLVQIFTVDLDADSKCPVDIDSLLVDGASIVISRYISDRWITAITSNKTRLGPIFYLMDDDVSAAIDTYYLPSFYRRRLIDVACGEFQTLLRLCDRFIVTSEFLYDKYASDKTDLLHPPFLHRPPDLNHLDDSEKIVITYHGTEGHKDDLAAITPALTSIHNSFSNVHLQIIIGNTKFVPAPLKGLARCEALPMMTWPEYKIFRANSRAHLGLAPILNTPYNRGKSVVKIHDISALGAVGIYTNANPYSKVIEHGFDGLLVENDPQMWFKSIKWLVERPHEIRRIAKNAQLLAQKIGDIKNLEMYWKNNLSCITN